MNIDSKSVAVIIVTHNSQAFLDHNIECLLRQEKLPDAIVVVDSGSTDPGYLTKHQGCEKVRLVFEPNNVGFCKGNNLGTELIFSQSDYILYLNPDAFLPPSFLRNALGLLESPEHSGVGCLTGPLLGYDIKRRQPTGLIDSTGIFRKWYGRWYDRSQGQSNQTEQLFGEGEVQAICGALMFCRKQALQEVLIQGSQVFDEKFYMYKEDIDLSLRLRKAGWKLWYHPELIAYHCRGWNKDRTKVSRHFRLLSSLNELRLYQKKPSIFALWALLKYLSVKLFNF